MDTESGPPHLWATQVSCSFRHSSRTLGCWVSRPEAFVWPQKCGQPDCGVDCREDAPVQPSASEGWTCPCLGQFPGAFGGLPARSQPWSLLPAGAASSVTLLIGLPAHCHRISSQVNQEHWSLSLAPPLLSKTSWEIQTKAKEHVNGSRYLNSNHESRAWEVHSKC